MIYSLGDININTSASFNINALIYSFTNFDIVGNPQSSFSGAIHSKGELNIGDKKSIGEFVYDKKSISELYSNGFNLISLPKDPKEEGKKTLEGIDSNRNGVRDDVEIFVHENRFSSEAVNMAYMQKAKMFPSVILTKYDAPTRAENRERAIKAMYEMDKVSECEQAIYEKKYGLGDDAFNDDYAFSIKLQASVFNTEDRMKLYIEYNGLLSQTFLSNYYGSFEIEECCQEFPHLF